MVGAASKGQARIVENKTSAAIGISDAERWGIVMDVQEALDGLAEMIALLADHDERIPHHAGAIIRAISYRLDRPLEGHYFP